jgi:hypothetical protein
MAFCRPHNWSRCFRWLPRQTHWCTKCGTWRITLDEDSQRDGYKYRYFRPETVKKGSPPVEGITIGKFLLSPRSGDSVWIQNLRSGEGMEAKIELLEEAIEAFWDKEF